MDTLKVTGDLVLEIWPGGGGDRALLKLRSRGMERDRETTPGVVVIWAGEIEAVIEALGQARTVLLDDLRVEAASIEGRRL